MNKDTLYVKRKRPTDMLLLAAIYVSATLAVALLLGIILYVFVKGIRAVNWAFLTTVTSARKQTTGIAGNLLNTLYIIVITLLIATPIGVGSAIYLNEYAKPGKLVSIIEFTTETLSGIPSIIFGLFGMIFFGETLGFGYSLLTGSFTLTLMVLPLIWANVSAGIESVDPQLLEMGRVFHFSRWKRIRYLYLPAALPYFTAAVSNGLGFAWKSGVAAEVLGSPRLSVGRELYSAKITLEFTDLFAWTAVVILVSILMEKFALALIAWMKKRL